MTIDPFEPVPDNKADDPGLIADGPDTGQWNEADKAELADTWADRAAMDRMLGEGGDGTAPAARLTNSTQTSSPEQGNDGRLPATAPDGLHSFFKFLVDAAKDRASDEEDKLAPKPGELEG